MNFSEFNIGGLFWSDDRLYRCTDKGTRVIVAIRIDHVGIASVTLGQYKSSLIRALDQKEAEVYGCFRGPPYGVKEYVFDEYDIDVCSIERDE